VTWFFSREFGINKRTHSSNVANSIMPSSKDREYYWRWNLKYLGRKKYEVYVSALDVRFPQKGEEIRVDNIYTVPQPDVCVICGH